VSFTYDLATDIGQLRLELGDTSSVSGEGVKPDGGYLTDEELQVLLDREGEAMRAVAAACELLARHWARVATLTVGPRSEQLGNIAKNWSDRAAELRARHGGAAGAFSVSVTRTDGYADNAVDPEGPDFL
jgi:hypothetical protein